MKVLPNIITLLNLAAGVLSILATSLGVPTWPAIFILLAVIFDSLDGRIARKLGGESKIGLQLDSLSDLVSFGVAPGIYALSLVHQHDTPLFLFDVIVVIIFASCSAYRLGRFNVINSSTPGYFIGLPTTANGVIFPFLFLIGVPVNIIFVLLFISAILMVSHLKIKKP